MANVESAAAVIDLETLLQPISAENPAGEYLRYSGIYDEISEARRADDSENLGDWEAELKVADYRKVIELSVSVLTEKSKDLQIGAWLSESLVKQYGFAGLRDSLKLISGLQENFWETIHPEIDEGDMEGRANAISWMDTQTSLAAGKTAITGGDGYGFSDWEDAKRFEMPENLDSLDSEEQERYLRIREQAEREKRTTTDQWRKAVAATNRAFCEQVNLTIEECLTEFNDLNRVIEEKFDRNQMPSMPKLKKALDDIHTLVKKLLEEKRREEPDANDFADESNTEENGEIAASGAATAAAGGALASASGTIQSRQEALRRLSSIADFFQKTEPHSPISYLVQRAVKWGNMPLDGWLQDVIKDEAVLYQLRETLGMSTNAGSAPSSEESEYQ